MSSPEMKQKERPALFSELAAQSSLGPDPLSPKISRVISEDRILTSKDRLFAPTLSLIKGICQDIAEKEEAV